MDSQIEENYNSLTWREQKHRREFFTYWRVELMRLPPPPHPTPTLGSPSHTHLSRTADSWNVLVKSHNYYMKLWNQSCKHRPWTECRQCQHEGNWAERQKRKKASIWFHEESLRLVIHFSLFCVIQVFTLEMHAGMIKTVACIWSGGQDWSSCVISKRLVGDGMSFNQTTLRHPLQSCCHVTQWRRIACIKASRHTITPAT